MLLVVVRARMQFYCDGKNKNTGKFESRHAIGCIHLHIRFTFPLNLAVLTSTHRQQPTDREGKSGRRSSAGQGLLLTGIVNYASKSATTTFSSVAAAAFFRIATSSVSAAMSA